MNSKVDAFVALGGNADTTGNIQKDTILDILKNEFELVLDLDDLLERIEVQNEDLDFEQFKKLFRVTDDPKSLSRNSSLLSLISQRSKKSLKTSSSVQTVKIRMKDFEKYLQRLEQEEKEQDSYSQSNTISPKK